MFHKIHGRYPKITLLGILLFILSFCSIRFKSPALQEPKVVLERMICCRSVEQKSGWARAVDEKTVFVNGVDPDIFSFVSLRDLHGVHTLAWKWYGPSLRIYRATDPINIGDENKIYESYIAWDRIVLSEDKEKGRWTVSVFLDGTLIIARDFEIK